MKNAPEYEWEMGDYPSFLDWSEDMIHIAGSSHITPVRLLLVTLADDMETLGHQIQNPEDDEKEKEVIQALEEGLVKNEVPVSV
jgi:hypothetical protein